MPRQAQRAARHDSDEIKTKIDLSHISKPGDVLNLLRQQQAQPQAPAPTPPPARPAPPAAPPVARPTVAPPVERQAGGNSATRSTGSQTSCASGPEASGSAAHDRRTTAARASRDCAAGSAARAASGQSAGCATARRIANRTASRTAAPQPNSIDGSAADAHCRPSSNYRTARAAHDCAADGPASRVFGSAPSGSARSDRPASRARETGSRATDFSAPAAGCAHCASAGASRRAPAHASHAPGSGRSAAHRSRARRSASRTIPSRQSPRRSGAPARAALRSAWSKRRPDEGLHAAAPHGGVERADAHHPQYHDYGGHQRQGSGREAGHSRQGSHRPLIGSWRLCHHQSDARDRIGHRYGSLLWRGKQCHQLRRADRQGNCFGRNGRKRVRRWKP